MLQVSPIVDSVRQQGDEAVRRYTDKFDKVQLERVCVPIKVCSTLSRKGFIRAGKT